MVRGESSPWGAAARAARVWEDGAGGGDCEGMRGAFPEDRGPGDRERDEWGERGKTETVVPGSEGTGAVYFVYGRD